jgi:demethylmenaquinone methyltransferase/2-methoxy-6-polyprenyl-1,4-benzoquinol methylase
VSDQDTHFGFETVRAADKAGRVGEVFTSVARRYDLMNDLMSGGLHRLWKRFAIDVAAPRAGERALDIASGSGDLARLLADRLGPRGQLVMSDINAEMLAVGRARLLDAGMALPVVRCDAERLPFASNHFDLVTVAFGLRNMTRKDVALAEMRRVLRPGGRLLVLEFSRITPALEKAYDAYSFHVLPRMGRWVARDEASYRYLAESIRMHPDQETLKAMLIDAGLQDVRYWNLAAGAVAVHRGSKG